MKKILALIVFSLNFHADLVLEITESASKPIKIAILEKNNNSLLGQEIIKIISNDLSRTGEFKVIANDELLSIPTNENEVIQRDWLLLDVDSIVFVDVQSQDNDLDISYSIFNICLLYTSPSPRDSDSSRMPSSA